MQGFDATACHVTSLALLLTGFSLCSALALALTHFRGEGWRDRGLARPAGLLLLAALSLLQAAHWAWLYADQPWHEAAVYRIALFCVAPAFFFYSRPILQPRSTPPAPWHLALHLAPAACAWSLPPGVALPLAFLTGAGYLGWLGRQLLGLRAQRAQFRMELRLLGLVFTVAVGAAGLGLVSEALPDRLFVPWYASAIGLAFLLVQIVLGHRPELPAEVQESTQAAYASTTLAKVDCESALARLDSLWQEQRLYADPALSLASVARRLELSPHQLSELVNTRLGKGFSRVLREHRIAAACRMLLDEPKASVLSVGLAVGFTSQSNFYEAFREIEGGTPGQYRKLRQAAA